MFRQLGQKEKGNEKKRKASILATKVQFWLDSVTAFNTHQILKSKQFKSSNTTLNIN